MNVTTSKNYLDQVGRNTSRELKLKLLRNIHNFYYIYLLVFSFLNIWYYLVSFFVEFTFLFWNHTQGLCLKNYFPDSSFFISITTNILSYCVFCVTFFEYFTYLFNGWPWQTYSNATICNFLVYEFVCNSVYMLCPGSLVALVLASIDFLLGGALGIQWAFIWWCVFYWIIL